MWQAEMEKAGEEKWGRQGKRREERESEREIEEA